MLLINTWTSNKCRVFNKNRQAIIDISKNMKKRKNETTKELQDGTTKELQDGTTKELQDETIKQVKEEAKEELKAEAKETKGKSGSSKSDSKFMKVMDVLVPVICAIVFLFSGVQLMKTLDGYRQAQSEYDALEGQYVANKDAIDSVAEPVYYVDQEEREDRPMFMNLDVDFASLKAINEDVVGWIYIPVLELSYPVVQGEDNTHYLHYTYEGTANSCGSIFLDSETAADMTDRNSFVYGHNMRNGSMFGSLKQFRKDPYLAESNPYVYYYTEDHAYKYKIFAYYITQVGSKTYFNFNADSQYDTYIDYVATCNEYTGFDENDFATRKNILTLSTCSGQHSRNRMITHAILVDDYVVE